MVNMRLVKLFASAACLATAVTITSAAASAGAATAPHSATVVHEITAAMHVVGFNKKVAAEHGYVIRTAPDGRQYSVKKGSPVTVSPANVVTGPCGYSYIYEYGIGNRAIELYTGFSVILPEVGGSWRVRLSDRGGTSFKGYGVSPSANGIWQIDRVIGGLTRGPAQATVVSGSSFAILDNGEVCTSGGPTDFTTIT
jgi:hypothetical protein